MLVMKLTQMKFDSLASDREEEEEELLSEDEVVALLITPRSVLAVSLWENS